MGFKYIKSKSGFRWRGKDVEVCFSNPRFQAFDEYAYVKSPQEILYYYYTVEIFKRVQHYNCKTKRFNSKWNLVSSRGTWDFPNILELNGFLETILGDIKDEMWSKTRYPKVDRIVWDYTLKTDDIIGDDIYSITRTKIFDKNREPHEKFDCYVGCAIDIQGGSSSDGVMVCNLSRQDVEALQSCVKEFIQHSIDEHNRYIIQLVEKDTQSHKTREGKLYYAHNNNGNEVIEDIYIVSDKINVVVLEGDIESKDFKSDEYRDCTIKDITKDAIIVSGGYKDSNPAGTNGQEFTIPVNKIIFMYDCIKDERLHFGIQGIVEDFVSILNDEEKLEFKSQDDDFLFERWKDAIISRTAMCRDEHNLPKLVKSEVPLDNAYAVVKTMVPMIRDLC